MPIPGGGAVGEVAVGELDPAQAWFLGGDWTDPVRKSGLSAAILASTALGFIAPQPSKAAVFATLAQQPWKAPSVAVENVDFSFISAPRPVRFSGFGDASGQHGYTKAPQQQTGSFFQPGETHPVPPAPTPDPPGGTSRKLVNGRFVNPLGTARHFKAPPIKVEQTIPLPPYLASTVTIPAPRHPVQLVERLLPTDIVAREQEALSALRPSQDELDARDIAEVLAMLDDDLD